MIAPGSTYAAERFFPSPGASDPTPSTQMPGSVSSFFIPKQDTEAGDFLEKIVTSNPEATQNLLDRGAVFNPTFRNVQQYPSTMAHALDQFNKE